MSISGNAGGLVVFSVVAFHVAASGGWVANIVKMFYALSDPPTGRFVARCVGIFVAPLGAILGYL